MIEKQIMIPKTVYETSDGQQFEKDYDAEKWECKLYFKNNMENRYRDVMEIGYCVLNSKEETEILETLSRNGYIKKGFYSHYLNDEIKFPIMVKFKEEFGRSAVIATKNDYDRFKDMAERFQTLCKMYESVN